jgi:hypothetical protein
MLTPLGRQEQRRFVTKLFAEAVLVNGGSQIDAFNMITSFVSPSTTIVDI